jgi:hypothetical protein
VHPQKEVMKKMAKSLIRMAKDENDLVVFESQILLNVKIMTKSEKI